VELDLLIRDGMICRDDSPPARSSLGVRDGRIAVRDPAARHHHRRDAPVGARGRPGRPGGTIEAGKAADVLVVDGDPARDVRRLLDKSRIVLILQDGRVVKDCMMEVAHGV
jgi:hypothetical protein